MSRRALGLFIGAACAALIAVGCGDDGGDTAPTATPPALGDIDLAEVTPELLVQYPSGIVQQGWPDIMASGDFNGDSVADILLGAPFADGPPDLSRVDAGMAYVLFGPLSGEIDLDAPGSIDVLVIGAEVGDNLGGGVAAGDLNGDGSDDLILGAPASNGLVDVRTDMGEVYVIFGGPELSGTVDILTREQKVTIQPAEGFSTMGKALAVADVNSDGIEDLIAGAPYAGRVPNTPPGGTRTTVGAVYVFYGGSDLLGGQVVARDDDDLRLTGEVAYDTFGGDVAAADINGDGRPDIIVGASGYDGGGGANAESGAVFVFFGSPDAPDVRTASEADVVLSAPAGYRLGAMVTTTDLDGDGVPEIAASAPSAPDAGGQPGTGRLYYVRELPPGRSSSDVDGCECSAVIYGTEVGQAFPAAVASSEDGRWLSLGSSLASAEGRAGSGVVNLLGPSGVETGDPGTQVLGAAPGDGLGGAVTFADVDGDGVPELLALAVAAGDSAGATLYVIPLAD